MQTPLLARRERDDTKSQLGRNRTRAGDWDKWDNGRGQPFRPAQGETRQVSGRQDASDVVVAVGLLLLLLLNPPRPYVGLYI